MTAEKSNAQLQRCHSKMAELPPWLGKIVTTLRQNHKWQRITKHTIAVTAAFVIVAIPPVNRLYGPGAFLAPMTTVFGHSGRRLGGMVEGLVFILAGTVLGVAWSVLGLYLSSLVFAENAPASYAIKAVFILLIVLFHGYFRSQSPRLFLFLWLLLVTSFTVLLGTAHEFTTSTLTNVFYPILTAFGVLFVVNLTVFPEFSSDFLGTVTIEALCQSEATLNAAVEWFLEPLETSSKSETHNGQNGSADAGEEHKREDSKRLAGLVALTAGKGKLRGAMANCKQALDECTFELTYAVLSPRSLKATNKIMGALVRNVVTLINACESKFALIEEDKHREDATNELEAVNSESSDCDADSEHKSEDPKDSSSEEEGQFRRRSRRLHERSGRLTPGNRVEMAKPLREMASADAHLLDLLLVQIREPLLNLRREVGSAIELVTMCLAYCCDVSKLPTGAVTPRGIRLDEIDIRVGSFERAIAAYDARSMEALAQAALMEKAETAQLDIMPRMETFLVSSVLLNFRQAATQTEQLLKQARSLLEWRASKREKKSLWLPRKIGWKNWLSSSGEHDALTLPQKARKEARSGKNTSTNPTEEGAHGDADDEETDSRKKYLRTAVAKTDEEACNKQNENTEKPPEATSASPEREMEKIINERQPRMRKGVKPRGTLPWCRELAANTIESIEHSDHFAYALKLAVAVFLVSFPTFYGPWNHWYSSSKAIWAPLQLILVFEVAIGSSFWMFIVRAFGVGFGCLWGFVSYEVGRGQLAPLTVVLALGIVPSAYVQLGTPYVKAGMISIVSMCVVALAAIQQIGLAWELFLKRLAAFTVGGMVAIFVEMTLYPVRARDRMVESLSACISHISHMEASIEAGVEHPVKVIYFQSESRSIRFDRAKQRAQTALSAAETFLPFCSSEPRLKGSFRTLEPVYKEIIYVLHQIIDRMDNTMSLRQAYGCSVLEEFDTHVHAQRRSVAASITLTLFAVNEALTTKMPLPQYLPSCRQAQVRLVHHVREILHAPTKPLISKMHSRCTSIISMTRLDRETVRRVTDPRVLSWNAAAAGQMEIIEYLEELVQLAKLLVGVNTFGSGMLECSVFGQRMRRVRLGKQALLRPAQTEGGRGDLELGVSNNNNNNKGKTASCAEPVVAQGSSGPPLALTTRSYTAPLGGPTPRFERTKTQLFWEAVAGKKSPTEQASGGQQELAAALAGSITPRRELDELPASLQRVGSRIRQERAMTRRMTSAVADGKLLRKGKGKMLDR